jgi:hypothetical protein
LPGEALSNSHEPFSPGAKRRTSAFLCAPGVFCAARRKFSQAFFEVNAGKVAKSRKSFPHLENPFYGCGKLRGGRYSKLENFEACGPAMRAKGYFFMVLRLEKIKK